MPEIPEATTLEMYRKMTEMRLFEKRAHDLFLQNLVKGTTHLGTGVLSEIRVQQGETVPVATVIAVIS